MRLSGRILEPRVEEAAPPKPTDEELVARYQRGEEAAFDNLVDRHAAHVARLVARLLGRSQEVADVVQDVFVDVLSGLKRFRGDARFRTWLVTVTVRRCRKHRRWAWTRRLWLGGGSIDPAMLADSRDPEQRGLIEIEQAEQVRAAVDRLPTLYREVIVLCYFEQMEIADIAKALRVSRAAVDMRLSRARAVLRERLSQWRQDVDDGS
jgi:RNA polymerase sigma-70 factor (ECF subfamily)